MFNSGKVILLVFCCTISVVLSSHFRGGIVMVRHAPGQGPYVVEITYHVSWRRTFSGGRCDSSNVGSTLRGGSTLSCLSGCSGTITSMSYICTDFSIDENWSFGERRLNYDFSSYRDRTLRIGTTGYCWISPFGCAWNVGTSFSMAIRSDTGQINSSPRAITSPVIRLQQGCLNTIALAVSDPDGDIIRCRWAVGSECAGICNWFPGATIDPNTCVISYFASSGTGLRAAAVMIEDYPRSSPSTRLSSVALQFLIIIVPFSGSCGQQPEFIDPTLPQGTCIILSPGETFSTRITATSHSSTVTIREIQTVSPRGSRKGSVQRISGTNNYYVDFTWTPSSDQYAETHLFCYAAVNSGGISSEQVCIQIMAGFVPPRPDPMLELPSSTTWRVNFDQDIQRPSQRAYISFREYFSEIEVYRVDSSTSQEVVFDQSRSILISPNYAFITGRTYYFNFDANVVSSTQGCNPGNTAITNGKDYWVIGIPPTVRAVSGNSVSASFGTNVVLRFEIQNAIPAVQPNGIVWTYNGGTTLNSRSQLNGASLSFSSNYLTLTISNINCNSGGRFGFSASNVAGSDSSYIDLYLIGPPQFRSRATNATVFNQQSPVSFTFDACAGTNPTVAWSRVTINGEESIPGFYNHIHATGSTLTLDHASIIGDVGEYTYRVSNSYGTIQDTVYLIVFVPLTIVSSPQSITVFQGNNAAINCIYQGTGVNGVTWISPSGAVLQNNPPAVTIEENGLFYLFNWSSTIEFTNVLRSHHEGQYTCRGSTESGATLTASAYIYVQVAPTVVSPVANRTIATLQGNSVTLNFQIINANPSVTAAQIEWYFNNTVALRYLTTLYGNTLAFSRDFRTLTISNLNYDIAGRVSVTALNLVGSSSDYVDLIIEGSPRFTDVPTNISASAGNNVTFTCSAFAIPNPTITWSHTSLGGIERNLTARTNVQIYGNTIKIFNVEYFQDGGKYTCTANNTHGVTAVNAFLNLDSCGIGGIDLVFVVDESGSIGQTHFQLFREFIENVSLVLNFGQSNSRVAVISFNDSPRLVFNLHQYTDRPSFVQAVRDLSYSGGGTDIAEALNFLRVTAQNGSLGINDNNRQIVMFMTDGQSDAEATRVAAEALHAANIFQVYAVGVSGANVSQLNVIAGGNSEFVFYSNTFDSAVLRRIEAEVIEELCTVRFAFATQPTNTTALQSTNTFINCEVDGTEIINITWISPTGLTVTRDFSHISIVTTSSSTRVSSSLRFANVQMSRSEGWYTCISYSYNGSTDNIISVIAGAYLYVQVPPFVRPIGPSTVIAIEHESVQISFEILNAHPLVQASGITWRYNDVTLLNDLSTLNGAVLSFSSDKRTLIISNVTYEIEGQYFFSAFNGAGRGSNLLTVNVEGSPKFTTRPMEVSGVSLGGSITLSCSASAVPEPTITWSRTTYYGTEALESSGNLNIDENDLTVSSVQYFEDDGNYSCIATNSRGTSIAVGRVRVHVPLDIATNLQNITANNGEDVSFTFTAIGSYFVNITWLSPDNIPLSPIQGVQTISTIISHTNVTSSLQFYNLQRSMAEGWYTCIAYAEYNFDIISVRSRAFLNVQVAPLVVSLQSSEYIVTVGSTHTLQFEIRNANPPVQALEIAWLVGDDLEVNFLPNGTVIDGTTYVFSDDYLSLTLINITYNASGEIEFFASNIVGISGSSLDLIVHGVPELIQAPSSKITVAAGGTAVFTCVVYAVPTPTITWHRLTNNNATMETLPGAYSNININGNILLIEDAEYYRDEGYYICRSSNYLQIVESVSFLKVYVPLVVQSAPGNVTSFEGRNVVFTCTISGTDIINVTWISPSGALLEHSSHTTITTDASPTRVISTLQIVNIQWPADHGFYTCRGLADNFTEITSIEATAHLHVQVCLFMGIKYAEGHQIQPNCTTRCVCQNGDFSCELQSCAIDGSTCYASGDPHYYTFDRQYYDFQGTCEYVLTQPCSSSEFSIIVTNLAHNQYVSCTDTVRVLVPNENLNILMGRGGTVEINGMLRPNLGDTRILVSGEVEVIRAGGRPHVILSRSGIRVSWDGLYRVEVTVSTSWRGRLCGLCGNYNDDATDDFQTRNGTLESSPDAFGLSWVVNNTQIGCGGLEIPDPCSADVMTEAQTRCAELQSRMFASCNSQVDPAPFIADCEYDYCYCNEADRGDCFCESLAAYASACANNGVFLPDWRDSLCPIECPSGAVYQQCGSLCPQTCDNSDATNCPSGCAEGCFCSEGLVSHNGACVDRSICPVCMYNDIRYEEGDQIQPECTRRCVCRDGEFICEQQSCTINGATCYAWGDPHYVTFDSRRYDFQGTCEYILTQPCNSSEFSVIVTNLGHNQYVSCTDTVRVLVPDENLNIFMERGGTVTINDILQPNNGNEVILHSGQVEVVRTGGRPHVILSTSGVRVSWDGLYRVDVTVSTSWTERLCGLCGDYNGNANDDFRAPDDTLTNTPNEFGVSWQYATNSTRCAPPPDPIPCSPDLMTEAQSRCAFMQQEPFSICNSVVDPLLFIESCEYDYCYCNDLDQEECYCNALAAYAGACAANGVIVPNWRSGSCAIQCPSGMVYQQCGPLCVRTCDNIGADCPGGCAEGCFCPDGLVILNGRCIDPIACPVCRYMGMEYEEGDRIQPNCSAQCVCQNGNFNCQLQNCVTNGATCYAWGDPHYVTFDSRKYDFQGTCEYILTQPCNSSEFSVIVTNLAHNQYVSCTDTVRVLVPDENLNIFMERGGTVTINDILKPNNGDEVILHSGQVEVVRTGGRPHVILSTSGVRVSWDGLYRVDVTVSTSWRGRLCGLCGDYNGNANDDFRTPDDTLANSPNEFGVSWQYATNGTRCAPPPDPIPCSSDLMAEAQSRCAFMQQEPFSICNNVVDPLPFIESCEYDYCYCNDLDQEECYCNALAAYAGACAANGVILTNWRNGTCVTQCPPGMVYQQCGSLRPQTCNGANQNLPTGGCAEGCFCPEGQVLVNGQCRHALACPVCTYMGINYEEGAQIQTDCSTRCTCQNGEFQCMTQPCLFEGNLCYASGDPHYYTFDRRYYDFQGVCEYVLTQPCNSNEFSVIVTNTAHNQYVSCTSAVRVLVPHENLDILLERGGSVTINDRLQLNNGDSIILQSNDTMVTRVGGHPHVFLTRSGIEVFFDGRYRVTVKASSVWNGLLCGLCGNYNGDPSDDFLTANGTLVVSPDEFGYEWSTSIGREGCGLLETPIQCSTTIMAEAESRCAMLREGEFAVCNDFVDPVSFISDCLYDYCHCNAENREECFCDSLSNYAGACASNGIVIPNWRSSVCAPECPTGMVYRQCGPRCPQTCDNIGSTNCLSGCAEGCFCPDGQVLSGGRCINPIACPVCSYMGVQYNEGDYITPNCSSRCVCRDRRFECEPQLCITDGATCQAYGDPHYRTFDSRYFDFQGTCEYVLTKSCSTNDFSVIVTNSAHNQYVSCTDTVRVVIPNENLNILLERGRGGTVTINDMLQPNSGDGVILQSGEVEIARIGGRPHIILSTLGVRVSWDGLYRVDVTVSTRWRGGLCGLCGNYNDDPNDDFLNPNGSVESSANNFGLSWIVSNSTDDSCSGLTPLMPCPADVMVEAQRRCAVLREEQFISCNSIVDPTTFIESCLFDYCHCNVNDQQECYCNSLSTYAGACGANGIVLSDWSRTCASVTECPPGMVYQQCGPLRPQTCDNNGIANCPYGCAEGCFCPDGLVLNNGNCIEPLTCPECIHMGMRYNEGDQIQPSCDSRCTCRGGEFICQPQTCIANGTTCYAWGDPHYGTFDLKAYNFQGDCEYIFTNSSEFAVYVSNRAHNSYVSCADSVTVVIKNRNLEIVLNRGGTVTINDRLQPNNGDEKVLQDIEIEVTRIGRQVYVVLIALGVRVSWDGLYRVDVTVSTRWRGRLNGLCGNYNGDPGDDFITSNNISTTSANIFGHSWVLNNDIRESCGGLTIPDPCSASVMAEAQARCAVLRETYFGTCNDVVDPSYYIESCVYDYCHCNEINREQCYCNSLAVYARSCSSNGIVLQDWRANFCPIECPTGMVYQQCGSLCIPTCTNNITSGCHDGCAEGCFCPDGQVLSNGKCINPIACPVCMHNGIAYEEGAQVQPNCSTRCTCRNGNFHCEPQNCITEGERTCYAYGDPHYYTFDRRYFSFQGTCEYVLTQSCNSSEFAVIVSNGAHNSRVSCTDSVRIMLPNENLDILLGRGGGGTVTVNDILQPNNGDEVILRSGQVEILRVGGRPSVILNRSGVIISWDGLYRAKVTVSGVWRERLCGLCGNFNDDPNDDFQTSSGTLTTSANTFGLSWMVGNQDSSCGELIDVGTCSEDLMREAQTRCNILIEEHFERCNNVLDPGTFIESCIFDYCYSDESDRENFYYNILATYAAACADDDVVLPPTWQNDTDSPFECPQGMVYQQCGPLCPQTCQNIGSSDCHSGCAEGCFCPDGQVLLGDGRCIDSVLCQECRYNGIVYNEGDQIQPNCSAHCTCRNGNFQCEPQLCNINGASCYAAGDPHYRTFDGRYFNFQGTCEYVLTRSCGSEEFSVIVSNGAHNPHVSCTDSVRVIVPGENLNVLMERGGRGGTVTVNNILQPNNGDEIILQSGEVEIVRVGGHPHIILNRSGIRVSWDGLYRVDVTVSTSWRGRLCGLCGNYNNNPADDFQTPNGFLASSSSAFGLSWLMNNDTSSDCGELTTPDPCPADIMEEAIRRCSMLRREPFDICNDLVNTTTYIDSCVYDYCYSSDVIREQFYYSSLSTYAAVCGDGGLVIPPTWRNESECPSGMIYQQCASLHPRMCGNVRTTTSPPGGCAAGCFCPDGQILRNGICIDPIACPVCTIMGVNYEEGAQIQPNCSTRCTCQNGEFQCVTQPCLFEGSLCYASGDPHYYTFDRRYYDFQGVCEYILTQPCNSNEFSVIVTNTAHNQYVSCTSAVRVLVPHENLDILLEREGSVTINDRLQLNNGDSIILRSNDTMVTRVGGHPHVFLTRSGIEVFFDGRYRVTVRASSVWNGLLCGLCGNYNGNPSDDFLTANGTLIASPDAFGSEWSTSIGREGCGLLETPIQCSTTVMAEAESRCAMLREGEFAACNNVIDPVSFISDCVYDYCHCNEENQEECFCDSLSNYAGACANNGVVIPNWRNEICAVECPPGMIYQQCGALCPQTCDNADIANCHGGCAEGCFCPDGLVISNGRCIDPLTCPVCSYMGVQYNEGDYITPNCSSRCVCRDRHFECEPQLCITDGATCQAYGDPHYRTFDQRYFNFQGTCEYVLTKSCSTSDFSVIVTNSAHNQYVSCTDTVRVVVPNENLNIFLQRRGIVTINDIMQANNGDGRLLVSSGVEVTRAGGRLHVLLNTLGVRVSWDGFYRVDVTVSTRWRGDLCGLCGNYNDDPNDDFLNPNGSVESSANDFGLSWMVSNSTDDSCSGLTPLIPCPADVMVEAQRRCAVLREEQFISCNSIVDPTTFIESCVFDYCHCNVNDREECYCNSLSTYAGACGANGIVLSNWSRTCASAASPTECPSGMVYQQCGSLCPQTCDNAEATICPSGCAEGCFCPHGLVAYNGNCIEPLTCPECIYMGTRYSEGDQIQPDCSSRCICRNGEFVCQPQSCVTDGATCYAWGDPHYRTFDLRKFDFQGTCEYVLTQSCNSSEFTVIVSNRAHNSYVSCTDLVRVLVPNSSLEITLGRAGAVTINNRMHASTDGGIVLQTGDVEVIRVGRHVHVVLIALGVRVSWDGLYRVDVTVSTSWRGRLCGLCGNYNGDPSDDFITPTSIQASSSNAFSQSWLINNDTNRVCEEPPLPVPCPTQVMTDAQTHCNVLRESHFSACNDIVDPTEFIESCVYDYCHCNEADRDECYCNSLAVYARACSANGIILQSWRENYCSVQCPAGMIYQQCGSLCSATCTSDITADCYTGCAEGCFCPDGLVLHNGNCIDPIACPVCMYNGIMYEEGSQIQPNCSTLCACRNGDFQCEPQNCIIDGGATCYAAGDPHYYTFDRRYFDFQGSCEYVLTQSCNSTEFAVIVANGAHNSRVSCTDSVRIVVPNENLNILLGRGGGGTVTINDILQPNNGDAVILRSGQVDIVRAGGRPSVVLRTSGVRVSWDGVYRVEVTVSTQWSGRLCGLCGNYNGDPSDDFLTPNGILETSANGFGLSWVLNNGTHDNNCGGTIPEPCPAALLAEAQERCNILRGGDFNRCNDNVDPTIFIDSCIFDYCYSNEVDRETFYFNSLAFYAAACGNDGEILPPGWRNNSDGADECPPGMVYQQCGSLCPRTCQNTDLLECLSGCVSGCFCPNGQVMQDGRCIDSILCQVALIKHIHFAICDPICKNPEQSRREHIAVQTKTLLSVVPCIFCFVFKVII